MEFIGGAGGSGEFTSGGAGGAGGSSDRFRGGAGKFGKINVISSLVIFALRPFQTNLT